MSELRHYGIRGMKWGARRYRNKDGTLTNAGKRRKTQSENLEKTTDQIGVGGVALTRYAGYKRKHAKRTVLTKVINASANAYITNNSSKYYAAKGVDYARRASISYMSVRDQADKINAYADVGKAAIYAGNKKRTKRQEVT